ncbi:MAG: ABC transporter ATP-binding protein [Sarcina sp.]
MKFSINIIRTDKKMTILWGAFLIATFLEAFSYLSIPYIEKIIIDKLVINELNQIGYLLLYMILFLVIHYSFQFLRSYLQVKMIGIAETNLKENILESLLELDKEFFIKTSVGKISDIIQKDTAIVVQFITGIMPVWIYDICIIVVLSFVLIFMNIYIYISIIPVILLINYLNKINKNKIGKYFIAHQENYSNMNQHIYEAVKSVDTIKLYNLRNYIINKYREISRMCIDSKLKLEIISTVLNGFTNFLLGLGNILIYILGVYLVAKGVMTIGDIVGFASYYIKIKDPIFQLRTLSENFIKSKKSFDRIKELVGKEECQKTNSKVLPEFKKIELKNVNFRYKDSEVIIKDFNFKIEKGDKIAIIGKSGVGKSTLKNLILNLYNVDSGEIFINDNNIKEYNMKEWYKYISVIDQEIILFNESINFNILLENQLTKKRVKELINLCDLNEFMNNKSFKVKDFGANLSGGQKKRIGLCRALAKDTDIYIFDELTSGLDYKTKEAVYKIFETELKYKTCIYITHDLLELKYFNKILNFDTL